MDGKLYIKRDRCGTAEEISYQGTVRLWRPRSQDLSNEFSPLYINFERQELNGRNYLGKHLPESRESPKGPSSY